MSKAAVVIDIETLREPLTLADYKKFDAEYQPPKNYKDPEKIAAHREQAQKELADKHGFRFDRNTMISCAMGVADGREVAGIECCVNEDPTKVCQFIVEYLADIRFYKLVGFNVVAFDLPIIVKHLAAADLSFPLKLGKWDVVDLFQHPLNRAIGLKDAARAYGLETLETTGADVARLWQSCDFDSIAEYNKHDVYLTGMLYNYLTRVYDI